MNGEVTATPRPIRPSAGNWRRSPPMRERCSV